MNENKEAQAYWTKQQVADYLGVSRRTVDNLMARRVIPFLKHGRIVRFPKAALDAHIQRTLIVGALGEGGLQ